MASSSNKKNSRTLLISSISLLLIISTAFFILRAEDPNRLTSTSVELLDDTSIDELVETVLNDLSLEEKIAQLISIRAFGDYYDSEHDTFRSLEYLITEHHIGGIIFFRGDHYNQATLTNRLQQVSKLPLWISQDMEFGAAMRVNNTTRITPAMGIAATGNTANAFEKGRITALEAKALGVHQIYAPVVDINNNPDNPVINIRSFSEDPQTVSDYSVEFIRGVQSTGLVATAKHFPGHGDTNTDSHIALPVIRHNLARLNEVELKPFRDVIDAGVKSIMTAHIAFPHIGSNPRLPATLDPRFMTTKLQETLGFEGLIVTDALEMQGISDFYSPGEAALMALQAGADILLLSPDEITAIHYIKIAIEEGEITEERIDHSVRKLLRLKAEQNLFYSRKVDVDAIPDLVHTLESRIIADNIARESITLLKNNRNIVPIDGSRFPKITLITLSNHREGNTGTPFNSAIRNYHSDVSFFNYDSRTSDSEINAMIRSAGNTDLIILGSFVHLQTGRAISFNRNQTNFINRLRQTGKPIVMISFSSPYILSELPQADVHMVSWAGPGSPPKALAEALFGATEINGKLPITIPGLYTKGSGLKIPQHIVRNDFPESAGVNGRELMNVDRIMNRAVLEEVFPGGVVAVIRDNKIIYEKAFGFLDYNKTRAVRTSDIYDLASLTKPIATVSAIMMLYDEGKIQLTDYVHTYFEEFKSEEKSAITIEHLLRHQSGLPPYRTYVDEHKTKSAIIGAVLNEPLIYTPGTETRYSDLGYILLGEIVEKLTGQSLNQYLRRNLFIPAGMTDASFNPSNRGNWVINRIPPTEIDTTFRNRTIKAHVHDERAYYMGGEAGHAGLFARARDVAIFSQIIMNNGYYNGKQFFKPETIELFTERGEHIRALGFDLKSLDGFTTAGQLSSDATFGHLGFTGTSFWIDPENNVSVVLLTNRTYPHRTSANEMNRIRASVMDSVMEAINE